MTWLLAVFAAVAAALAFAVSAVFEQRSAHDVPQRGALDPRLLWDLARKPLWLAAIGFTIAGLALQIAALRSGSLALVQPLLVCDLLFAVLIRALFVLRRPADRVVLAGVLCCAGGLAAFLVIARPHGDRPIATPFVVVPLAAALAAALAACLTVARFGPRRARPLAIALACGVVYGVSAFLLKEAAYAVGQGVSNPVRLWPLYAVVIVGPVGFLLNQSAFQAGILIAPVLAVITVADPLVSISIARLWLDEQIAAAPADVAAEVIALAVMTFGIIV
ncbi:MAG: DMT family transporter, partial [Actinobacteria bacterium]|nr:DMT family transporter [Actinomycetota bacterium]